MICTLGKLSTVTSSTAAAFATLPLTQRNTFIPQFPLYIYLFYAKREKPDVQILLLQFFLNGKNVLSVFVFIGNIVHSFLYSLQDDVSYSAADAVHGSPNILLKIEKAIPGCKNQVSPVFLIALLQGAPPRQ